VKNTLKNNSNTIKKIKNKGEVGATIKNNKFEDIAARES